MATQTITKTTEIGALQVAAGGLPVVKIGSLRCKPLHPTFAAEYVNSFFAEFVDSSSTPLSHRIEGVDFSKPVPEEQIRDIIAVQDK